MCLIVWAYSTISKPPPNKIASTMSWTEFLEPHKNDRTKWRSSLSMGSSTCFLKGGHAVLIVVQSNLIIQTEMSPFQKSEIFMQTSYGRVTTTCQMSWKYASSTISHSQLLLPALHEWALNTYLVISTINSKTLLTNHFILPGPKSGPECSLT